MSELLPCPFCGGEQVIKARYIGYGSLGLGSHDEYRVVCQECRASSDEYRSEAEAIAAWNRRVDARQLVLKTKVCPMCEDCPDGCPVETPKDSRNIVTNADHIRSMSDEELARFLWEQNGGNRYWKSVEKYLDWLKQPVKEEV
jgi:Lar family restriction alleviation protein